MHSGFKLTCSCSKLSYLHLKMIVSQLPLLVQSFPHPHLTTTEVSQFGISSLYTGLEWGDLMPSGNARHFALLRVFCLQHV